MVKKLAKKYALALKNELIPFNSGLCLSLMLLDTRVSVAKCS